MTTLRLGKSRDFKPFTNLVLETSAELGDGGTIKGWMGSSVEFA